MEDVPGLISGPPRLPIDEAALKAYLETTHQEDFPKNATLHIGQFDAGQSNPTYFLQVVVANDPKRPCGRYVLRKKPPGKLLPGAHQIDREFKIMSALQGSKVPVPRTICFCEDTSIIGTSFYIMAYVPGRIEQDPMLPMMSPSERRAVHDHAAEVLAHLHLVDFKSIGLSQLGKEGGYVARQIKTWHKQYVAADPIVRKHKDHGTAMDKLYEWVHTNVPSSDEEPRSCICHGDFRMGNVIIHPTEPRIVAVLDWELCTIGDPFADLAYYCNHYYITNATIPGKLGSDANGTAQLPDGIPTQDDVLQQYCKASSQVLKPSQWTYYKAFQCFRIAAIQHGVVARGLAGNASSTKALNLYDTFVAVAQAGLKLTQSAIPVSKL